MTSLLLRHQHRKLAAAESCRPEVMAGRCLQGLMDVSLAERRWSCLRLGKLHQRMREAPFMSPADSFDSTAFFIFFTRPVLRSVFGDSFRRIQNRLVVVIGNR